MQREIMFDHNTTFLGGLIKKNCCIWLCFWFGVLLYYIELPLFKKRKYAL